MPNPKAAAPTVYVDVEYYRSNDKENRALEKYLRDYEAVQSVEGVRRKASGAVELGHLFSVYVLPVIGTYAANKVLQIIEDRVKQWFRERGKKDQFITLGLSNQKKRRKIGKGRPKRYY